MEYRQRKIGRILLINFDFFSIAVKLLKFYVNESVKEGPKNKYTRKQDGMVHPS